MLLVLLVLLNILIFSDRVMGCVYAFILDLVRSAAVWLLCLSDWIRRDEGCTVIGVWPVVCIPSSWVQCPVVYTQHWSSSKITCWL